MLMEGSGVKVTIIEKLFLLRTFFVEGNVLTLFYYYFNVIFKVDQTYWIIKQGKSLALSLCGLTTKIFLR